MYDRPERWMNRGGRPRGYDRSPRYGSSERGPYDAGFRGGPRRRYGADYWWMGERAMPPQRFNGPYDDAYRRFSARTHPRYSPVDGLQPGMGGGRPGPRPPSHARENAWFSDWTRWF